MALEPMRKAMGKARKISGAGDADTPVRLIFWRDAHGNTLFSKMCPLRDLTCHTGSEKYAWAGLVGGDFREES